VIGGGGFLCRTFARQEFHGVKRLLAFAVRPGFLNARFPSDLGA
jgi:hypothetical protein